jgi:hypothetical protein
MSKWAIVFVLISLLSSFASAQTNEVPIIQPDRPSIGNPPFIVPLHKLYIETGFAYERNKNENILQETFYYNTTLLRYGLTSGAEIRLQVDYITQKTNEYSEISKITGFEPISIGSKLFISDEVGLIPKTSFSFNITLPDFGNKNFRPPNLSPSFYLLAQNNLSDIVNLCYDFGFEWDSENMKPTKFYSICLGINITDEINYFVENYGYINDLSSSLFLNTGVAYLIGKSFQLDISGALNINKNNKYFLLSSGLSFQIPN